VVPPGTVTVKEPALAAWTDACTDPKKTILLEAVSLKFAPVIVTTPPTLATLGLNPVISGGADAAQTETVAIDTHPNIKASLFIVFLPECCCF
jgi:hypothetical protein